MSVMQAAKLFTADVIHHRQPRRSRLGNHPHTSVGAGYAVPLRGRRPLCKGCTTEGSIVTLVVHRQVADSIHRHTPVVRPIRQEGSYSCQPGTSYAKTELQPL